MRRIIAILSVAAVLGWFSWEMAHMAQGKILERGLVIEEICQ